MSEAGQQPTTRPPKLGLDEMLAKKNTLRETGIDKTHVGCINATSTDGKISYKQTELDPS